MNILKYIKKETGLHTDNNPYIENSNVRISLTKSSMRTIRKNKKIMRILTELSKEMKKMRLLKKI